MMLSESLANGIFDILVSHGNLPTDNAMLFSFKRDEFMYHSSRDITEYHYKNSNGSTVTINAHTTNDIPVVLKADESASDEEKAAITQANEEIVSYVAAVLTHDMGYLEEHDIPWLLVDTEAASL